MDLREAETLRLRESEHWYYVSKARMMLSLLDGYKLPQLLDVGAGSGVFSKALLDASVCDSATCLDINYPTDWQEVYHGRTIQFARRMAVSAADLVLMADVLEHVDDDSTLLRTYANSLKKGGLMLVTVPAFNFLWSDHDRFLQHRRRYTVRQVETLIEGAGLHVLTGRYFYGLLFPIVASIRLTDQLLHSFGNRQPKSHLKEYSPWVNTLLTLIHDMERNTIFKVNKLAGLSVACLASKL